MIRVGSVKSNWVTLEKAILILFMQYCSMGHLFFQLFKYGLRFWIQLLVSEILDKANVRGLVIFEKEIYFGFVYTKLLYGAPLLFKIFKSGLRFWIQLLVSEILDKTNVRGWVTFEKSNNFGASLLFKLFKSD